MLQIEKLTKRFNTNTVVNEVSFEIKAGEIFSLIGPNGSGKTTIVKLIAGLLRPNSGKIIVGGIDIARDPVMAKTLIGYIPDEPAVWPSLTGEEFLRFTGAIYGLDQKVVEEQIQKLLPVFSLEDLAGRYFEDYSRGNKQKFAILAALLHRPHLLLVDEPIVGLDPESAQIAKQELKKFSAAGGAILMVTHTLLVAQEISTTIGVLKEGKLLHKGSQSQLVTQAGVNESASLEQIYGALTHG